MTERTHITALVPYTVFPAKMGGQKGIALFYEYLSRLLPITVITTESPVQPNEVSFEIKNILGRSRFRYINPLLFFKVRKSLIDSRSTHLILEHPYFGWLAFLLKITTRIILVVHSHNIESLRFKSTGKWWWKILWYYERFIHRNADINFFITEEDRLFAIDKFGLKESQCFTITYGTEYDKAPSPDIHSIAREQLNKKYNLLPGETIMLFNGTLNYPPNLQALDTILQKINPLLLTSGMNYKIFICGKGLPPEYDSLRSYAEKNIIYPGFVDDINLFFAGADVFINPVTEGGGIKTKLVESLASNLGVVSTATGAIGVSPAITGKKLLIIKDGDWKAFTHALLTLPKGEIIPTSFYNHFYWGNIANKVTNIILATGY